MSTGNIAQQPGKTESSLYDGQPAPPDLPNTPTPSHQSPRYLSPASTKDVNLLDQTELTIPEEDGSPAWREAFISPRAVGQCSTVHTADFESSASMLERSLQAMLVSKRRVFVEKWQRLGTIMKLRPGWIEERVAAMEATWRKEYVRELERYAGIIAASPVEGLPDSSIENQAESEVETKLSQRRSKLPRYKTTGTFVNIEDVRQRAHASVT